MLDRSVLRWGGLSAMAGGVIGAVANIMHPRSDDLGDPQGLVDLAAGSGIWVFDHYLIAWATAFALFGLIALCRSLVQEPARSWGWITAAFAIASTVVTYLLAAIDGVALKAAADVAIVGPAPGSAEALAVAQVSSALFTAMMGAVFGIVPILLGIALLSTTQYPRWLGTLALASGVIGVLTGSYQYLVGYEPLVSNYLFTLGSLGTTVVLFAAGWFLWKGEYAGVANEPIAARL